MMEHDYKKQGKVNRRKGGDWERKVKKELKEDGWIVNKSSNQIDVEINDVGEIIGGSFINIKMFFSPFNKAMMTGSGFPDFVCFKKSDGGELFELMFVECKLNGKLSREEKLKMEWLGMEGYTCYVAWKDELGEAELKDPDKAKRKKIKEVKKDGE